MIPRHMQKTIKQKRPAKFGGPLPEAPVAVHLHPHTYPEHHRAGGKTAF